MSWLWLLLMWNAHAGWDVDKGADVWTFEASWHDHHQRPRELTFTLPSAAVKADLGRPIQPAMGAMRQAVAREVRQWAAARPDDGVRVTASVRGKHVDIGVVGPRSAAKRTMREAQHVRDEAAAQWIARHGYQELSGGVSFDHAMEVGRYKVPLEPLAKQIQSKTRSQRAMIAMSLSMVQSLPYEARLWRGGDPGFRPPLALLGRRRGDCDSKTVLFLSLVRAAYPELPLAVVYVPGHALAGVAIPRQKGDKTFRHEGVTYVVVEPVGPARHPIGTESVVGRRN